MLSIYDNYAEIGDYAKIENWVKIGNRVDIGDHVEIGNHVKIGNRADIGNDARIGNFAEIGNFADIGNNADIGDYAKIGNWAEIGDNAIIGNKFRCEGLEVIDFFTMSNIDGTGRRLYVYVLPKGIAIRAGCFIGTLDGFCNKAEEEAKYLYAVTVRAAAEAFADEVHRQGKTGGWAK